MDSENEIPDEYAESVMLGLLSEEGSREVSVRLARFPSRGEAHVWLHVAAAGSAWSVVDESFTLPNPHVTPIAAEAVSFIGQREAASLRFDSSVRTSAAMQGRVSGSLTLDATRHPEPGSGSLPCAIDLGFVAHGSGFRSQTNRWELTGRVTGSVTIDETTYHFEAPGKWHEQTGPRARFAPPFTYLNLQGREVSLLAIRYPRRATGYAMVGGQRLTVESFTIAPEGVDERSFSIVLSDRQSLDGVARVVQRWSVPIEGRRRPGSSVLVESSLGPLFGSLNDWDPGPDDSRGSE